MSTPDRRMTSAVVPIYKSILGVAEVRPPTCSLTSTSSQWRLMLNLCRMQKNIERGKVGHDVVSHTEKT